MLPLRDRVKVEDVRIWFGNQAGHSSKIFFFLQINNKQRSVAVASVAYLRGCTAQQKKIGATTFSFSRSTALPLSPQSSSILRVIYAPGLRLSIALLTALWLCERNWKGRVEG